MSKLTSLLIVVAVLAVIVSLAATPSTTAGQATSSQSLSADVTPGIIWQDNYASGTEVQISHSQITYQGQAFSVVIAYSAGT